MVGPLLTALFYLALRYYNVPHEAAVVAAVTLLCSVWWTLETLPIFVTSLLPVALFPLLGVMAPTDVAGAVGHPLILLLLGGFILSKSMECSGAHRRGALWVVRLVGTRSSKRLVFGFMAASAAMSLWISNTATTLMLLPVALAAVERSKDPRLTKALVLGLGYSASVGGIGTPVGTPPNVLFMSAYEEITGTALGFTDWMTWGVPVVVVAVPAMAWWLTRNLSGAGAEVPALGPISAHERRVLLVFGLTALAWVTRTHPNGGWKTLLQLPNANDASVALLACVALFAIPNGRGGRLLNWNTANEIPWGVLLLFAGGLTIAKAFGVTGLSKMLGQHLTVVALLPPLLLVLLLTLVVSFLTEVTSNTATTALLLPILGATALSSGVEASLLMVPATMAASCAFMLPVATAPNAVIYSSGYVTVRDMVRQGFVLNLLVTLIVAGVCFALL